MYRYNVVRKLMVSFIVCSLLLAVAIPAAAQTKLYEVQLDIFNNDELIHSPSAIVAEGKEAVISVDGTSIALLISSEGAIEDKPIIGLSIDVDEGEGVEREELMSSTLLLPDRTKNSDPAMVSVGSTDVVVSVRRMESSEAAEVMENAGEVSDCESSGSETLGFVGDHDVIGGDNCCSASCRDGTGGTMTCCGAISCCACGACCSP